MQPPVETQHAEARTVVQRGVLKGPAPRDLHVLHVDLNRLARLRLLEQLHLAGFTLPGPPQPGQSDVTKDPLNRAHGQPRPVHPIQRPNLHITELDHWPPLWSGQLWLSIKAKEVNLE